MGVLVVRIDDMELEACSDWLWQLGATAIEERSDGGKLSLFVGFGHDDLALEARSVLGERWPCRFESTGDEAAWRDEWIKWIEPIQVAGFVVHAPWHNPSLWADAPVGSPELSIDPGRAFGSGHHPTTRLALTAMRSIVGPGARVLDVGCGTGILSIAAARLGAKAVLGIDLDYDILEVADANVEANGVADQVSLRTDDVHDLTECFDIVVANIVIGDLMGLMPAVVDRADSAVVISGFLGDQFERLLGQVNIDVAERTSLDGWGCAILTPTN
ncbi:MAG: 50S ribosomal protein L11 methyltransferase [Acidimicrobiales bacterium]|jgi:ribosomal protein L11 methyltransferase